MGLLICEVGIEIGSWLLGVLFLVQLKKTPNIRKLSNKVIIKRGQKLEKWEYYETLLVLFFWFHLHTFKSKFRETGILLNPAVIGFFPCSSAYV